MRNDITGPKIKPVDPAELADYCAICQTRARFRCPNCRKPMCATHYKMKDFCHVLIKPLEGYYRTLVGTGVTGTHDAYRWNAEGAREKRPRGPYGKPGRPSTDPNYQRTATGRGEVRSGGAD